MSAPVSMQTLLGLRLPRGVTVQTINVRGDKSHTVNAPAGSVWACTGSLHSIVVYTKEELQEVLAFGLSPCEDDALGDCEECQDIARIGGAP